MSLEVGSGWHDLLLLSAVELHRISGYVQQAE